jgi:nucleoside-diphosphate-sugar epimerase
MVERDVVDEVALATVLASAGYDVVFHLAAYSMIERSALEPQASVRTNVMGIVNLLTALSASARQDPESIVLLSTDKVYGESGSSPTDEAAPLTGRGLYEVAKAAGDMLARTFHQTHGLPVTVVRPCNVYGPHDYGGECRLVPRALRSIYGAAEPQPPELYFGSIQHRRDFLYVGDAVEMILAVGATPGCAGEVFNLTGDTNLSSPEMLRSVVECAAEYERKFDERRAERILANGIRIDLRPRKSRAVVIENQRINGDKLVRILGVRPKVTLQEGLRRTVAAFRDYFRGAVA